MLNTLRNFNIYNFSQKILVILCLLSFWGAVVYRIYALDWPGVIMSIVLAAVTFLILQYFVRNFNETAEDRAEIAYSKNSSVLVAAYLILSAICFFLVWRSATTGSIISPWQIIGNAFFLFYFLATLSLIIILQKPPRVSLFLLILHYLLSFSIIGLVYKLGFGYDSFIHQATLELIDKHGLVEPKPNYYLGQYGLIIILHKLTALPLLWLNRWLVMLLAAVSLPVAAYSILRKQRLNQAVSFWTILFFLSIPFSFLTFTTPQNFSYLLLLLAIIYGLETNAKNILVVGLLALAALVTQPIAGIPAVFYWLLLIVKKLKYKKIIYPGIFVLSAFSLPLAFYLFEKSSLASRQLSWSVLFSWPMFLIPNQENFVLNFIYLIGFNLAIIVSIAALIGIVVYCLNRSGFRNFSAYLIMAFSLAISFVLTKILPFDFLIEYERNDYADRILLEVCLFLLPFIWITLMALAKKIIIQEKWVRNIWLLFICLLVTSSLYLSYPRFDRYFNSRGYSTGNVDLQAVDWIEKNSKSEYIVLANQQVSAAALHQFGFSHYYKNNIFYYPIPTGGPLYKFYLDMVYGYPSRDTMQKAMDLAGVKKGYFVLNRYWWGFRKLADEAKLQADGWQEFGNEDVYVFSFSR